MFASHLRLGDSLHHELAGDAHHGFFDCFMRILDELLPDMQHGSEATGRQAGGTSCLASGKSSTGSTYKSSSLEDRGLSSILLKTS